MEFYKWMDLLYVSKLWAKNSLKNKTNKIKTLLTAKCVN